MENVTNGEPAATRTGATQRKPLGLIEHTGATGGMLVTSSCPGYRLTPIQFNLLQVLWERCSEDLDKHEAVRGYVSSAELLCLLPWDSVHPDGAHLKQLIRRIRRRLLPLGFNVQACYGLGYRLVLPDSSSPTPD